MSIDKTWPWTGGVVIAVVGWAILAIVGLIRLVGGMASVCRLCREAVECDNAMILGSCRRAVKAIGLRREPQVVISPETGCPTVLAWGRPKVFIPPITGHKRDHHWFSVFNHELAHVQRGDGWAKLAMETAAVLLPWQPLIRVLQSVHRQACEEACDD
jgi:beta-lactamase regulating signal transducer with metallopeptidase domain